LREKLQGEVRAIESRRTESIAVGTRIFWRELKTNSKQGERAKHIQRKRECCLREDKSLIIATVILRVKMVLSTHNMALWEP
jgi:hypothetical protein